MKPPVDEMNENKGLALSKASVANGFHSEFSEAYHLQRYAEIGMSLSGEEDINTILEMILTEARELTCCDAGSLYMINDEGTHLAFVVLQNDTMKTRMGGSSGVAINLPPVPLVVKDKPNYANVSSHVALTGEIVKIADVYESQRFDFTGPRKYDQSTGYRSKSMLVIPLRNHENDVIGVMQLLNAMDPVTREVTEFHDDQVSLVASLASQAAAALTKTRLIQDLKNLFYSFIKSIAGAIEEKSPYTGGHINRVVDLSMMMAKEINEMEEGPFADVQFSDDDLEELKLAAWLHDVGKITTPEHVVDKASKLETIFDRVHLVENRFQLIAKSTEATYLRRMLEAASENGGERVKDLEREMGQALAEIAEDREFIIGCNEPGEFMSDERIEKMRAIGAKIFTVDGGEARPYLTEDEMMNLAIRKGTLSDAERKIIENHATMTGKILGELPFPKKLTKVPEYAAGHHEKLDGSGYPLGLKKEDLSLAARIMAVADIFEALTAKDRPYKKPMQLSQAVKILGFMRKDNHIDPDIYDLFLNSGIFMEYAKRELLPWQVDEVDVAPSLTERRVLVASSDQEVEPELVKAFAGWGADVTAMDDAGAALASMREEFKKGAPYRVMALDMRLFGAEQIKDLEQLAAMPNFPRWAVVPVAGPEQCGLDLGGGLLNALGAPIDLSVLKARVKDILARPVEAMRNPGADLGEREDTSRDRKRVLIADTSANTRMLLKHYLSGLQVEVVTVENGPKAMGQYKAKAFDLLIVAMHLSGVSGFETVKQIRGWEAATGLAPVPIIGLTAHYVPEETEKCLEAGCSESLAKPVTRKQLAETVEACIFSKR